MKPNNGKRFKSFVIGSMVIKTIKTQTILYSLIKTNNFFPLYHPAAALYNGAMRETLISDFKKIPAVLKKITP